MLLQRAFLLLSDANHRRERISDIAPHGGFSDIARSDASECRTRATIRGASLPCLTDLAYLWASTISLRVGRPFARGVAEPAQMLGSYWHRKVVSELIEFSAVIGDVYDAAIDPTRWQQALASVCAYVGG